MKFTPSQQAAISITGRNLVVSAGAGSGKTATLIERIYRLVTDPVEPRRIDQLLVVTFTRAAAGEMKERLVARFRAALADGDIGQEMRSHIEEQLYMLPGASISTIHSFCLDVISSFPNLAGLAPGFELMSVEEARLLRREFLADKIAESLGGDEDETSRCLRRILDVRDPLSGMDTLVNQLAKLHEFLDALVDHDGLLDRQERLANPKNPETRRLLTAYVEAALEQVRERIAPLLAFDPQTLNVKFREQLEHLRALDILLAGIESIEQIPSLIEALSLPALSRKKMEDGDEDLRFKELRTEVMGVLRDIRKELAILDPETLPTLLQLSADLSLALLRGPGVAWNRQHFELHMSMRKLTFSHLEKITHRLLHDIPESERIRAWYRERFTDVLVDEFQDVNELQDAIIRAVSSEGDAGQGGNRFFVGDVKQSIYQFRQADPTLFLRLLDNAFPHGGDDLLPIDTRIDLVENFRSSRELLGEMNQLFERLLLKETAGVNYRDGHSFIPGRKGSTFRPPEFSLHLVDKEVSGDWEDEQDTLAEAVIVANRIREIGPPWCYHTILLRSTRGTAPALIEALSTQGIPVYCEARIGFLTAVEVIEFQSILRAISNPFHDIPFLGMLRGPAFRWSDDDLLSLRLISRDMLYIQLVEAAAESENHPLAARAGEVLECLAKWQEWATRHSMADFFALLMDDLHLLDGASTRPGGDQRRLNLEFLLERGRQFDRFARKGLDEFLRFLDDLIENGEDFAPPSPLSDDADVVRIMTIHASKGMQFPLVYIPFLGKRFNEEDLRSPFLHDREIGLVSSVTDAPMPEDAVPLLHRLFRDHLRRKLIAEELRLLYVALTRAEEGVMMTGTTGGLDRLNSLPSDGAIPPARIQGARSALDWLVAHGAMRFPAADFSRSGNVAADGISSLVIHRGEQLESLQPDFPGDGTADQTRVLSREFMEKFQSAQSRIDALAAAKPAAVLRAKVSVTELKRTYDAFRDHETPPYHAAVDGEDPAVRELELPAILRGEKRATGAQRGQAVHRFLAHCDLPAIGRGERRLTEERDRLVAEEILTTEEARLVSLPGIQWFFNSDLGKEVLRHGGRVERERPFIVRVDASEIDTTRDGDDMVILQGVADLLYRTKDGWVLIDFKTDYCGEAGEKVPNLAKGYTAQVWLYQLAIERALGEKVTASWLVFLHGRENWQVEAATNQEAAWQEIVRVGALETFVGR